MNRTVIITGASRGIGRETAIRFAKEKDILLLCGNKNVEALKNTAACCTALGASVYTFLGDLSDSEEIRKLWAYADEVLKVPDLLINNAGISHVELFQDSTDENYMSILNANLNSCVRMAKEAAKRMVRNHSGRILNLSSVFGLYGASCEVEYSVTKGGINSLTKSLAKELAPSGISVNALAPGAIDTEMNHNLSEEERTALSEEIPFGRMATAEETAEMLYLLSIAPQYLTGQVIQFDGGWI